MGGGACSEAAYAGARWYLGPLFRGSFIGTLLLHFDKKLFEPELQT